MARGTGFLATQALDLDDFRAQAGEHLGAAGCPGHRRAGRRQPASSSVTIASVPILEVTRTRGDR
jgi:hypothetical protein